MAPPRISRAEIFRLAIVNRPARPAAVARPARRGMSPAPPGQFPAPARPGKTRRQRGHEHAPAAVHGEAAGGQPHERRRGFGEKLQEAHNASDLSHPVADLRPRCSLCCQPTQNRVSPRSASATLRCGPVPTISSSAPACNRSPKRESVRASAATRPRDVPGFPGRAPRICLSRPASAASTNSTPSSCASAVKGDAGAARAAPSAVGRAHRCFAIRPWPARFRAAARCRI